MPKLDEFDKLFDEPITQIKMRRVREAKQPPVIEVRPEVVIVAKEPNQTGTEGESALVLSGVDVGESFIGMFQNGIDRISKLAAKLETIEEIILEDEFIRRLSDKDTISLYDSIGDKLSNEQRFLMKMFELGSKNSIMERILQASRDSSIEPEIAENSPRVVKMKGILQKVMEKKILGNT